MRLRTKEKDDKMDGGLVGLHGSGWAPFLLSSFFLIASSLLFLAAIFWGKTREALKRALKQIKFGKIEFI
jgi:hypothetical protein